MAKEIGRRERKRGSSFGSFCSGTFFGFILCLALICGTLAFAYFKVSPKWVNDKFDTNINLGSDELNNLTIKEAVDHAIGLSQNMDSYTLSKLETDFGVKLGDSFKGIDISELKDVPLSELSTELQNTLTQISAAELEKELVTFDGDIQQVLNSSFTYYFNIADKKLYKEYESSVYSNPVTDSDFKYSYVSSSNKIDIKGQLFNIESGKVKIGLKYLPIVTALSNFSDIKIADVMGLSFDGTNYYNDLNNNSIVDSGEEVSVVLNSIAGVAVGELTNKVNALKLADVFSAEDLNLPIFKILGANAGEVLVSDVASELQNAVSSSSILELNNAQVITLSSEDKAKLYGTITYNGETRTLGSLTISEFIEYAFDIMDAIP